MQINSLRCQVSQIRNVPYGSVYRSVKSGAKCYEKMIDFLSPAAGVEELGSLFLPGPRAAPEEGEISEDDGNDSAQEDKGENEDDGQSEDEGDDSGEEEEDPEDVRMALDMASAGGWKQMLEGHCHFPEMKAMVRRLVCGDLVQFVHLIQGAHDEFELEESLTQFAKSILLPFVRSLGNDLRDCAPASGAMHDLYVSFSREVEGAAGSREALQRVVQACYDNRKGPAHVWWLDEEEEEEEEEDGAAAEEGKEGGGAAEPLPHALRIPETLVLKKRSAVFESWRSRFLDKKKALFSEFCKTSRQLAVKLGEVGLGPYQVQHCVSLLDTVCPSSGRNICVVHAGVLCGRE
jgi:hypothetical protein